MDSVSLKKSRGVWGGWNSWCSWGGWKNEESGAGGAVAAAGAALAAAAALLLPLPPQSRVGVWRGLALFALGLVHFVSLFSAACSLLLRHEGARRRLTRAALLDVANKAVSALQALWAAAAGGAVCAYSCTRSAVHTFHYLSDAYAWFGAAYFFYDIWSMYVVHVALALEAAAGGAVVTSQTVDYDALDAAPAAAGDAAADPAADPAAPPGAAPPVPRRARPAPQPTVASYLAHETLMIAHHCFIGGYGFLVIVWLRGALGDCVFGFVYLMEVSTVFVCARGVLARLGRRGPLYAANGAAMLASFALCRLAALPAALLLYARDARLPPLAAAASLPARCQLSVLLLLLPQLYWFYLMCRGAARLARSPPPAPPAPPARS